MKDMMKARQGRYGIWIKATTMVLVCLFCANMVVLAYPDTLAPLVGNPKVQQAMIKMMNDRLEAHQESVDKFIHEFLKKEPLSR